DMDGGSRAANLAAAELAQDHGLLRPPERWRHLEFERNGRGKRLSQGVIRPAAPVHPLLSHQRSMGRLSVPRAVLALERHWVRSIYAMRGRNAGESGGRRAVPEGLSRTMEGVEPMNRVSRRQLLGSATAAIVASATPALGEPEPPKRNGKPRLKLSLAA